MKYIKPMNEDSDIDPKDKEGLDSYQSEEQRANLIDYYKDSEEWIMKNEHTKTWQYAAHMVKHNKPTSVDKRVVPEFKGDLIVFNTGEQYVNSRYSGIASGDKKKKFAIMRFEDLIQEFGPIMIKHKEGSTIKKWLTDNGFSDELDILFGED